MQFDPNSYRGWEIHHLPQSPSFRDTYVGCSPDYDFDNWEDEEDCGYTGQCLAAGSRMALIAQIDEVMK